MLALTVGIIAIIGFSVHASSNTNLQELKLLHIIIRHGARTPVDTYPKDPYITDSLYPIGWGHLTNQGKLDLFNIGKYLRGRYAEFLGRHYNPDEYYAQSTDSDRTKMSVQLINAGLWPPEGAQKWGPLDWQPIPVHAEPLDQDHLLLVRRPCAQYHLELDRVMALPEIQDRLAALQPLFTELEIATGKKVSNFDDVQDIYSTLRAEVAFNLTLPAWTQRYYPDKMASPTIFSYVLNAYTDKLKRLKGGVLLKKILNDWRQTVEGVTKQKLGKTFLYGGHDSTVTNLLSALKVWDPQLPEYGITVLLELSRHKITNQYGVQVYLRNSTEMEPYLLTIPGCAIFCPLDEVIKLTETVIPDDWEKECASDDPNYKPPPPSGP